MRMSQPHLSIDYEKKEAEASSIPNKDLVDILETTKNDLQLLISGRKALYALLTEDDKKRDDIKEKLSELSQKIIELRLQILAYEREYGLDK